MATVILDVPSEKIKPFIQLVMDLGLEKHAIASGFYTNKPQQKNSAKDEYKFLKNLSSKFLLFDWEFFSNELEFE
jgi:hypothetical protein